MCDQSRVTNRIVGHATGARITAQLPVAALRTAIARRGPVEQAIVHSDRGSQFRSRTFRQVLADADLLGSRARWSRPGTTQR